ncbi:unnamed protein product [Caenorhabditis brenneri]
MSSDVSEGPTKFVLYIYRFFFLLTVLYGSYRVFFGDPVTPEEYQFGESVVLSWIFIAVIIFLLTIYMRYRHQKRNLNELEQCRNFLLITLGGFAFFGFLPRFVAPFCSGSFVNISICVALGGIAFLSSSYFNLKKLCRTTVTDKHPWKFILIHLFVLFFENFRFVSLLFSSICAMSTIEFFYVWRGKIEMTDEDKGEDLEWLLVPQTTRFKCNVCHKKYNRTTRIPRMLKECGHTICEECGDGLRNENTRTLQCPFCQVVTFNEGPANRLPKNFALMETVELNSFQNLIDV